MKKLSAILMILFMIITIIIGIPVAYKGIENSEKINPDIAFNGKWTSLFENKFADILPPKNIGLSLWGKFELMAFGEGRQGVIIGKEGWLFTNEEFTADKNRSELLQSHKDYIVETSNALHKNNISLIIALIPAKARIMSAMLDNQTYPSYNENLYSDLIKFFKDNNMYAPSLLKTLSGQESIFFKTDTHWTPKGAKLTARKISETIKTQNIYSGTSHYIYGDQKKETFDGDLASYVPAGKLKEKYGITQNISRYRLVTIKPEATSENTIENDLFGDTSIPATIVGTSYSANPQWNFENHLKYYLQSDVYNAADEGLGPFATMRSYLNSNEYKNMPPRLIIWEIPERYMVLPEKK